MTNLLIRLIDKFGQAGAAALLSVLAVLVAIAVLYGVAPERITEVFGLLLRLGEGAGL